MYEGLEHVELLKAYFRDHGITEEELFRYIHFWFGFEVGNLKPDEKGFAYLEKEVRRLIEYRDIPLEETEADPDNTIWAWPTTLSFQTLYKDPPESNDRVWGIMHCCYQGKGYYFGIGKEEVKITEDMRKNGEWSIYTYAD